MSKPSEIRMNKWVIIYKFHIINELGHYHCIIIVRKAQKKDVCSVILNCFATSLLKELLILKLSKGFNVSW